MTFLEHYTLKVNRVALLQPINNHNLTEVKLFSCGFSKSFITVLFLILIISNKNIMRVPCPPLKKNEQDKLLTENHRIEINLSIAVTRRCSVR